MASSFSTRSSPSTPKRRCDSDDPRTIQTPTTAELEDAERRAKKRRRMLELQRQNQDMDKEELAIEGRQGKCTQAGEEINEEEIEEREKAEVPPHEVGHKLSRMCRVVRKIAQHVQQQQLDIFSQPGFAISTGCHRCPFLAFHITPYKSI